MEKQREKAIIINIHPSGEKNLVVKAISEESGKLVLFAAQAKNSTKRFGKIDLFDWGMIEYHSGKGNLLILDSFKSISSFPELRSNFQKIITASCFLEIIDKICPEQDPNSPEFYKSLLELISALNKDVSKEEQKKTLRMIFFSGLSKIINLEEEFKQPTISLYLNTITKHHGIQLKSYEELRKVLT